MRYIDVDKLKEVFDEHEDDYGYLHGYWEEFIDNAPTADVRENIKGEWIDRSDGGRILHPWWESYECNQCGYSGSKVWNFCPNCGADMRREDNGRDEENHNRV